MGSNAKQSESIQTQIRRMEPVAASPEELAKVEAIFRGIDFSDTSKYQLVGPNKSVALPPSIFYALERIVEVLAKGDSITIVPVQREMTTQKAADLLNVSRQYLVRLLDEGKIPSRKVGRHRRVKVGDVLNYKTERDKDRRAGLRELTQMTEEFGGYNDEFETR